MRAQRVHPGLVDSTGRLARFVSALWFIAVMAIQPALALTQPGPASPAESHVHAAKRAFLFTAPVSRPTLIEQHVSDGNPSTEKRGPELDAASGAARGALNVAPRSSLAMRIPHRLARATGQYGVRSPRAPPLRRVATC